MLAPNHDHAATATIAAAPAPAVNGDRPAAAIRQAYQHRIEELRVEARLDAVAWNADSATDFWAFISTNPHWRKGLLGLMDNGNLYAVWQDAAGNHLSIQFKGLRFADYVIFKRRPGAPAPSRVAGSDTLDGVKAQVKSFDLRQLVSL